MIKDDVKQEAESGEEADLYCDITDCNRFACIENWLQWTIKHNDYATTDIYAHYCQGHFTALYALYGTRRINVLPVTDVICALDKILE